MSPAITEAVILILNTFDQWQLIYEPNDDLGYDAHGYTPKNIPCVIRFYYSNKEPHISKSLFDKLMKIPEGVTILYVYVNRSINYLFWIPEVEMQEDGDVIWLSIKDAKLVNFGEKIF